MRNVNCNVLSAGDNLTTNGSQVDANQLVSASFHAYFGDATAAGTFKLQVSNDLCPYGNAAANFTVTHWVDLPTQTASISSGTSALLTVANMAYRWIRPVYTTTATGAQHILTSADAGAFETITITCPATADAAQADYVVIYGSSGTSTAFWLDIDAAGTAPTGAVYTAATTKIKVSISTGDTNIMVGAALRAAAASTQGYGAVDNLDGTVTYTQTVLAACSAPQKFNANDSGAGSFVTHVDTAGHASSLQSKYFLLNSANSGTGYYVWFNVSSLGTDPTVAGRTGVEVDISAGSIAADVATAVAAAIDALAEFVSSSASNNVTVTNASSGPFVPMSDFNTGFTFSVTGGGTSTINVNMNALSL